MGILSSKQAKVEQWTPRWKAGKLAQQVHLLDRYNFKNKPVSNYFSTNDKQYSQGLYTLGLRHLWWLAIALLALFISQLRYCCTSARQAFNTALRVSIYICASALFIGLCLQIFLHAMVLRSIPAIVLHPQHNGEIRHYMRKVQTQTRHITYMMMQKYNGRARNAAPVAIKLHRTIDPLIQASESLIVNHLDPRHARVIYTPVAEMMLKYDWKIFMFFTVLWCVGLATVLILACYNQDLVDKASVTCCRRCLWATVIAYHQCAAVCGVTWCALMAFFLTLLSVGFADVCHDPRQAIYYLALPNEIAIVEQLAIEYEYERLCYDWLKQFRYTIDQYEKKFLYASFMLSTIAHVEIDDYHYLYLWDMSDTIRNVSIYDVVKLRNILPPRCDYDFLEATARYPGHWTTRYYQNSKTRKSTPSSTTATVWTYAPWTTRRTGSPTQAPPTRGTRTVKQYYKYKYTIGPTRFPNYDTTVRVLCAGDNNLKIMIAMLTVVMVAGAISAIAFLTSILYMQPRVRCPEDPCRPRNVRFFERSGNMIKNRMSWWTGCTLPTTCIRDCKKCYNGLNCCSPTLSDHNCCAKELDCKPECNTSTCEPSPVCIRQRTCMPRQVCTKRKRCNRRIIRTKRRTSCLSRPGCRRQLRMKLVSISDTKLSEDNSTTYLRHKPGSRFMGDREYFVYPVTIHNFKFKPNTAQSLSPIATPPQAGTPPGSITKIRYSRRYKHSSPGAAHEIITDFDPYSYTPADCTKTKKHRKHKYSKCSNVPSSKNMRTLKHESKPISYYDYTSSTEHITAAFSNLKHEQRATYTPRSHSPIAALSKSYVLNQASVSKTRKTKRKKDSSSSSSSTSCSSKSKRTEKNSKQEDDLVGLACSTSKPCKGIKPCTSASSCSGPMAVQKPCTKALPCPKTKPCPESQPCPGGSIYNIRPKKEPDPRYEPTRPRIKPCTLNSPCSATKPCPEYEPCRGPVIGGGHLPCSIYTPCPGSVPKVASGTRRFVLPKKIPKLKKKEKKKRTCSLFRPCSGNKPCAASNTCPGPAPVGPPPCTKANPCAATEYCPDNTPCPGSLPPGMRPCKDKFAKVPKSKTCTKVEPCESTVPCPVYAPCPGTPPDQIFKPCSDTVPCPGNITVASRSSNSSSSSKSSSGSSSTKSRKRSSSTSSKQCVTRGKRKKECSPKVKTSKIKTNKRGKSYTVAMASSVSFMSISSIGSSSQKSSRGSRKKKKSASILESNDSSTSTPKKAGKTSLIFKNRENSRESRKKKKSESKLESDESSTSTPKKSEQKCSRRSRKRHECNSEMDTAKKAKKRNKKKDDSDADLVGLSCSTSRPCKGDKPCTAASSCSGPMAVQKPCTKALPCPKTKPCPESQPCPGGSIYNIRPKKEPDPRYEPTRPRIKPCTLNSPCSASKPCPEYEPCRGPVVGGGSLPCSIHTPCPGSVPKVASATRRFVLPKKIPKLKKKEKKQRTCSLFRPCSGNKPCAASNTCPGPAAAGPPPCTKASPCAATEYCPDNTPCPGSLPPGMRPCKEKFAKVPKSKICTKVEPCESTVPCPVYAPCPGTPPDQIFKPCSDTVPCPGNITVASRSSKSSSHSKSSSGSSSTKSSRSIKRCKPNKSRKGKCKPKSEKVKVKKHGKTSTVAVASSNSSMSTLSVSSAHNINKPSSKPKRFFRWENSTEKKPVSTTKSKRGWSIFKMFSASKQFPLRNHDSDSTSNTKGVKRKPSKASILSLESVKVTPTRHKKHKSKLTSKYEKRSTRLGFNPSLILSPPQLNTTFPKFKLSSEASRSSAVKCQDGSVAGKKRIRTVYVKLPPGLTPSQPVLIKIDDDGHITAPERFREACMKAVEGVRSDGSLNSSHGSDILKL